MSLLHNPVLTKELRGRMRGARAFVVLTVFLLISSAFTLLLYMAMREEVAYDPFTAGSRIGKTLFLGVATVALIQVMIIVPAQAAGAIAGEKEQETYDLLITTLLPPWKIVLGKLLAALAYAVLLIIAVVPLMALAFFFGGVTGTEVMIALLGLLATALLYGSVGILWSTLARRTIAAMVLAQATNVLVLLGIPFLMVVFGTLFVFNEPRPPDWLATYPFIYAAGSLLAVHPFIALGGAELLLANGEERWFFPIPELPGANEIWIPAPWIAFLIAAIGVSVVLIFLATRQVRRIRRALPPPPPLAKRGENTQPSIP